MTVERFRITGQDVCGQATGLTKGGIEVNRAYAADTGRLGSAYASNADYVTAQDFSFAFDIGPSLSSGPGRASWAFETYHPIRSTIHSEEGTTRCPSAY